ncbi:MAG: RNA polymerase sigma factor [Myxococcales bacterium]
MFVASPLPVLDSLSQSGELAAELVEACRHGDRRALGAFVRCYERRVFAYLSRSLGNEYPIEDLAQDVFVRAYPALARFDVAGAAKLSTWLLTIAHRVAVDARRRRREVGTAIGSEQFASTTPSPEQQLGQEQLRAAIARAVDELPEDQRDVFVLSEFHDLSTTEIARVVGVLEATVKTRLFRARARLRLALGPLYTVEP